MEIILIQDMANLGPANTVVNVKPGYARNYLIPQGIAIVANTRNKNILNQKIKQQQERALKHLDEAKELAVKLSSITLRIVAKAGASGKIFGSVTEVQIAQAIKETSGVEVARKNIALLEEVKMLGTYSARITLHKDVAATVTFEVFEEK